MKLILKQSVPNLGDVGEVVNVKPGFGRNYLIPQGFAYIASAKNLARIEAEQARAAEEARRDFLEARRRASQLEGFSLSFQENAGEDGQLFGSVSVADITDRINSGEIDFTLDKRAVQLDDVIKVVGEVLVPIKLHTDVTVEVTVSVEAAQS
ncbi:MAG TPA: 50S ribosomal protein L9 [Gemmatimonadetes bacterium]|jgi:large subunit ribosomal protein L9|nr:50S ribosomal protein L9 [Gemmatimonadota bacterium]HCW77840.1 50S ribosomal protein L9 [Gemmatimonadota bacterium]|tara:strand:- start:861 stop:1316 length:456 start_codon:yes stop_codon:yes gene_type:complete